MNISGLGGTLLPLPSGFGSGENSVDKLGKSPADEFLDYARKSPAERIHEAILKEMGLTEEEFEAMGPEERGAIQKEIAQRIKDKLEQTGDKRTGLIVDVTA